jgi:hypothetical protein
MSEQSELRVRLTQLLDDIEQQLGQGDPPPTALEDMKANLDGIRTGVLALASAADDVDYERHARRYRLKRAAQICESVLSGIGDGSITPATRGFTKFSSTVGETLEMVERLNAH